MGRVEVIIPPPKLRDLFYKRYRTYLVTLCYIGTYIGNIIGQLRFNWMATLNIYTNIEVKPIQL